MKYRKKPIIIEAFQYDGDLMNKHGEYYVPQWAINAFYIGKRYGRLTIISLNKKEPRFNGEIVTREIIVLGGEVISYQ
mgnify:CR=1 FL=1